MSCVEAGALIAISMNSPGVLVYVASAPVGNVSTPMICDPTPLYARSRWPGVGVLCGGSVSLAVPPQAAIASKSGDRERSKLEV